MKRTGEKGKRTLLVLSQHPYHRPNEVNRVYRDIPLYVDIPRYMRYYIVYPRGFCFPTPSTLANPDGFMRKVIRIKLTFVPVPVREANGGKSPRDRKTLKYSREGQMYNEENFAK